MRFPRLYQKTWSSILHQAYRRSCFFVEGDRNHSGELRASCEVNNHRTLSLSLHVPASKYMALAQQRLAGLPAVVPLSCGLPVCRPKWRTQFVCSPAGKGDIVERKKEIHVFHLFPKLNQRSEHEFSQRPVIIISVVGLQK